MGVPINPTKSIVKESQRRKISKNSRRKYVNQLLFLFHVKLISQNILQWIQLKERPMIREELSECGNFNTALKCNSTI